MDKYQLLNCPLLINLEKIYNKLFPKSKLQNIQKRNLGITYRTNYYYYLV